MLTRVGNLRTCRASFSDPQGKGLYAVDVTAETKLEAAVKAFKAFRQEPWASEAVCSTGYLEVTVTAPAVTYKILLKDLHEWLEQTGGSPRDVAQRAELRALLHS
jgi:hypothetical protein